MNFVCWFLDGKFSNFRLISSIICCLFCRFSSKRDEGILHWNSPVNESSIFRITCGFSLISKLSIPYAICVLKSWGLNANRKVREWYFVTFSQSRNILSRTPFENVKLFQPTKLNFALISRKIAKVTFVISKIVCFKNHHWNFFNKNLTPDEFINQNYVIY